MNKKEVFQQIIRKHNVFVHLRPDAHGVRLPERLQKKTELTLEYGLDMHIQIPDLEVSDLGVSATLSFSRVPQLTFVPWSAVYAIVGEDQRGMVWNEDMPPGVVAEVERETKKRKREVVAIGTVQLPEPQTQVLKNGRQLPPYMRVVK